MEKFFIRPKTHVAVAVAVTVATEGAGVGAGATASAEQKTILDLFGKGANISADCVAGSGKTTTVLLLAKAFPTKQFIQITYNSQLKMEVRAKVEALDIKNLEIHTYHSLWVRYYNPHGYTDDVIRRGLDSKIKPMRPLPHYDAVIVDEAQDMTFLYYCLVHKFIQDANNIKQLLTFGDCFQSIYKFKGSDHRFLTLSNEIWGRSFVSATLSTSYRVTCQIAEFVNTLMLGCTPPGTPRIQAVKQGAKVDYIISNTFSSCGYIADRIEKKLNVDKLNPDDIFVLCPSLTSSGAAPPSRKLENELVKRGIPCYYPTSDERKLDEEIIKGKVVFSTFHQSKGRERKYVIVYGFDQSYFMFFAKDMNPYVCPETLYVAVTRAKEELVLLHDCKFPKLSFIEPTLFDMSFAPHTSYLNIFRINEMRIDSTKDESRHAINVTDLTKFIKEENIKLLTDIANTVFAVESEPVFDLDIPCKLRVGVGGAGGSGGSGGESDSSYSSRWSTDELYEDISDINGIVIPAIYESESQKCESTIEKQIHQLYDNVCRQQNKHMFIQNAYFKMNRHGSILQTIDDYIRMGILYVSLKEEIYHKIAQIDRHDWLDRDLIQPCFSILSRLIDTESAVYERRIDHARVFPDFGVVELVGRLDVFDIATVFEIKCVQALTLEHKMQLLVYAWMWKQQTDEFYSRRDFKLVNIRTGEILILDTSSHLIDEALHILLENKYGKKSVLSDAEFIDMCVAVRTGTGAGAGGGAGARLDLPAPCKTSTRKCLIVDEDEDDE